MDSTIVAALVGGLFTVVASVVTFLITRLVESDVWATRHVKQIALNGRWEGTFHQDVGPEDTPVDYPGTFAFETKQRTIQGVVETELSLPTRKLTSSLAFEGRFVHERFLQMEYHIKGRPEIVHFGSMLLKLSSDGHSLNGHFLGYSAFSQRVVSGTIQIHKPGNPYHP